MSELHYTKCDVCGEDAIRTVKRDLCKDHSEHFTMFQAYSGDVNRTVEQINFNRTAITVFITVFVLLGLTGIITIITQLIE